MKKIVDPRLISADRPVGQGQALPVPMPLSLFMTFNTPVANLMKVNKLILSSKFPRKFKASLVK